MLQYADRIAAMRGGMICLERKRCDITACEIHQRLRISTMKMREEKKKVPRLYITMEGVGLLENGAKLISADLYNGRATGVLCCGPKGRGTVKQIFSSLVQTSGFVMQNGRIMHLEEWRQQNAGKICCLGPRFWGKDIFENLTAAENIVLRSMNQFRERGVVINRRMLRLALRDFAAEMGFDSEGLDVYLRCLSGRMRDRLVLLRMMFTPVDLLVLDYPFYTIDEQIKSELLRCIAVLQSRGTAVLWSSNDRSVLEEHCENTVVCE